MEGTEGTLWGECLAPPQQVGYERPPRMSSGRSPRKSLSGIVGGLGRDGVNWNELLVEWKEWNGQPRMIGPCRLVWGWQEGVRVQGERPLTPSICLRVTLSGQLL